MNGKDFPEEFDRIDKVKSADKMLINDSSDGINKYATPGQFNASLKELEMHYEDAVAAQKKAEEAAATVQTTVTDAKAEIDKKVTAAGGEVDQKVATAKQSIDASVSSATTTIRAETQKAKDNADAALRSKNEAETAKEEATQKASEAKTSEENAKSYAQEALKTSEIAVKHDSILPGTLAEFYTRLEALQIRTEDIGQNALLAEILAEIIIRIEMIEKKLNAK